MRWLATFFLSALAGCATLYQDMGFSGGVAAYSKTSNTFRIEARQWLRRRNDGPRVRHG
jgi:hypothetical protein